ncbi:MAG: TetR/AcrR family transcriptional regulator [Firmicutes bacterium]|nr:TetR/AcrR family transcriptional regulator [Bacillota bacterium]
MDPEKQRRIMDAVLKEFAEHGYLNASTNRMVQEAQIGKGMLFYYFKNKEELFRYAFEYSLDYIAKAYVETMDYMEPDFITRYTKALRAKMEAYVRNPLAMTFVAEIYLKRDGAEVAQDLYDRLEEMTNRGHHKLFSNVDTTRFRPDVPAEQIINLVRWSIEGYQNEVISALDGKPMLNIDWEPYLAEFHDFLNVLRRILYKQGG